MKFIKDLIIKPIIKRYNIFLCHITKSSLIFIGVVLLLALIARNF